MITTKIILVLQYFVYKFELKKKEEELSDEVCEWTKRYIKEVDSSNFGFPIIFHPLIYLVGHLFAMSIFTLKNPWNKILNFKLRDYKFWIAKELF